MISQTKPEMAASARDFFRVLFRHKAKVVACSVLMAALAVVLIVFLPRKYRSESKLFVHVGRESVALDPTASTGQMIPITVSRETEVNSVLEMLRSRFIIEKLVDDIGPETILRQSAADAKEGSPSPFSNLMSLIDIDPVSDRERAIAKASSALYSAVEKKSDVITVSGTAKSPELAQKLVGRFVEIYLGEHAQMHRTAGSQNFFVEQKALLQKNLSDAMAKLRDAKNSLGILSVQNQREIIRDETVAVETRLAQTQSALAASRDKVVSLREKVKGLPERLATDQINGLPTSAADSMRSELYQLEVKEAELSSRFQDGFPALVAVRAQIAAAKKPLHDEEYRRTQQTTGVNQVHAQLQVGLLTEESNLASLQAETKTLDKQLAQLHDRARLLNEHEVKIANLEQEVALCNTNYATYSEKSEQSRIDAALQNERITNVNVIQPANLVAKPISPQKSFILALGVFGGIALGIGVALLAERLDPTLKSPTDVEDRLALPVLLTVPRVPKRHTVLS